MGGLPLHGHTAAVSLLSFVEPARCFMETSGAFLTWAIKREDSLTETGRSYIAESFLSSSISSLLLGQTAAASRTAAAS